MIEAGYPNCALVFVHGGSHGAWCFEPVAADLAERGILVVTRDLPGHGLAARFPASYGRRPLGPEFATEVSPLAGLTLDDYARSVVATVERLRSSGVERVVLVGHSLAGLILNRVGETHAEWVSALVYLAASMPRSGALIADYLALPENAGNAVEAIQMANPSVVGALRIDPRSSDPEYREHLRRAFYDDLGADAFAAVAHLLTPDVPAGPLFEPTVTTPGRWGSIPRHYITCLRDTMTPPALADLFIREADALTPENTTRVHELDTGHSPFLSRPSALADVLEGILHEVRGHPSASGAVARRPGGLASR